MSSIRNRVPPVEFLPACFPSESQVEKTRGMILLFARDQDVRRLSKATLSAAGFDVGEARSEQEVVLRLKMVDFDLVLIDVDHDDFSLIELVGSIRDLHARIPVFLQCSMRNEGHEICAFDAGVNDFIVKPINDRLLAARIFSAIRLYRCQEVLTQGVLAVGDIVLDPNRHTAMKRGTLLHLTVQEFTALEFLMNNPGQLILHATFMHFLWGENSDQARKRLRVLINSLRKKLERDPSHPKYLLTEVHLGYRFESGVSGAVHRVTPTRWN